MEQFDLNLMPTFCALYEERSATRAAKRLSVSQPAVSYALRRLRSDLGDQLFVRAGRAIAPTAQADLLYPEIKRCLEQIYKVTNRSRTFFPQHDTATFTLALSDLGEYAFGPAVMRYIQKYSPHSSLEIEPLRVEDVVDDITRGAIDGAMMSPHLENAHLERHPLRRDRYVVIAAADHPRIQGTLTATDFARERHVRILSSLGHSYPMDVASAAGLGVTYSATVSRFTGVPPMVSGTELLATVPYVAVSSYTGRDALQVLDFPLPIDDLEVALYTLREDMLSSPVRWLTHGIESLFHPSEAS